MDYTKLFYWITVADNARNFFVVGIVLTMLILAICVIILCVPKSSYEDKNNYAPTRKYVRRFIYYFTSLAIIFWIFWIGTPSKKNALLIIAGGQTLNYLTTDSTAKTIPHELTTFLVTEIKNLSEEAKVEIAVMTNKEKVFDEAKKMTTDQLIERMNTDSIFANIILNK